MRMFTFVTDYRSNIEVHATGCRDIAQLPEASTTWTVVADTAQLAVAAEELPTTVKVKVNACCNPRRMDAAGRGHVNVEVIETVSEEQAAFDAETAEIAEIAEIAEVPELAGAAVDPTAASFPETADEPADLTAVE